MKSYLKYTDRTDYKQSNDYEKEDKRDEIDN